MHETKTVDSEFRLWVSVQPHLSIPSSLLQGAVKLVADSPKVQNSFLGAMFNLLSIVKPKPKQSFWPITRDADSAMNQSKFEANVTGTTRGKIRAC